MNLGILPNNETMTRLIKDKKMNAIETYNKNARIPPGFEQIALDCEKMLVQERKISANLRRRNADLIKRLNLRDALIAIGLGIAITTMAVWQI